MAAGNNKQICDIYDTVKQLGRGTFGHAYLCKRKHNNQKMVVKDISTDLQGEQLKVGKNEINILRSLNHPNIIKYYDSFFLNNSIYIVMEYATHGTLQQYIAKVIPYHLQSQEVMDLFCQILMGLDHIHEKNIIHRDLKCENIFLTGPNGDIVKIGDFGISKTLSNCNMANTVIGTCNYLAPELCDGKPYNKKSDIWSLGCILFEMCEREKLFEGSVSNVVLSIASGKKKMINMNIYGKQMQDILDWMLQVDPDSRPDTKTLMTLPDVFPTLYLLQVNLGCID